MARCKRHIWTDDEIRRLRESYATVRPVAELAAELGVSATCAYQKAQALGLRKPFEYHSVAGKIGTMHPHAIANRFKPGSIPPNKGKKLAPDVYAKLAPTMFRKGHAPVNHKPVGSERVNVDGYVEVKVAEPNRWRLKHRVVWEAENGEIPPGHNVQFKDGNPLNVSPDNLYLISRSEQLRTQNSLIARYPKELADVIRLKGAVKRQITLFNRKKKNKDE